MGLGDIGGVKKFIFPKFNLLLCLSYSREWHVQRQNILGPHPLGPWGGAKNVKYHLISFTKSISKIFKPNLVCLLINERYITYQTRFSFSRLGHAQGVGLGGTGGGGGSKFLISPQIQPNLVCE